MTPRAHIIGRQVLDVEIDVGEDFFALQQEISRVFQARVAPALDALFSRCVDADTVLRLDRLTVDVGRIDRADLEEELTTRILEALEPMLLAHRGEVASVVRAPPRPLLGVGRPADEAATPAREAGEHRAGEGAALAGTEAEEGGIEGHAARADALEDRAVAGRGIEEDVFEDGVVEGGIVEGGVLEDGVVEDGVVEEEAVGRRTMDGHTVELWHYFLQNGHFPWWAPALEASDFEARVMQALEAHPAFLVQTRAVVRQAPVALHRLVLQGSDAFLDHLIRVYRPALSPRLLQIVQDFSGWAAAHPALGVAPRAFRQVFWREALHEIFTGLPQAAPRAEQAVVRRTLQHLSHRLSVSYPALLVRIQAAFAKEEPQAAAAPGLLVRGLVEAFLPPARVADVPGKAAAPAAAQAHPAHPSEETEADADTRRRALGEAVAAPLDGDEPETATQPARPGVPEAAAEDMAPRRAPAEPMPQPPAQPPKTDADHLDPPASVDRLPEEERRFREGSEQQQPTLPEAARYESHTPPPALRSEAAEGTAPARGVAEGTTEAAGEDAAASQTPDRDEENAWQEAVAGPSPKEAAAVVRGEASAPEKRPFLEDRPPAKPIQEGAALYLRNAGLVLLHPYLTAHFEHLGLVENKAFVDEDTRHKAIYQLQYLATGHAQALEYSLTLNKLLCGHPLEAPLARDIVLGEAAHAEADALLRAVLRNWPALKNTSPDGLREGFLQRDGKLTRKPFSWLLQVEQKSHDILLGRLPWGIGIIKLPWMPDILHVEWA